MDELFELGESLSECERISKKIDELDLKARVRRLKEEARKRSEQLCREYGIISRPGLIVRSAECGGIVRAH